MFFFFNKLEPVIIWKLVTCQRITSKNTRPRWVDTGVRDTVRWYWWADAVVINWQLSIDHNMDVHWFPCGAFRWSVTVTWLPNFLGWVDLLSYEAPPTHAWSSAIKAHLITMPGEKSGTMLLKDLKREFCRKLKTIRFFVSWL